MDRETRINLTVKVFADEYRLFIVRYPKGSNWALAELIVNSNIMSCKKYFADFSICKNFSRLFMMNINLLRGRAGYKFASYILFMKNCCRILT
jgi:hypothetical protein